MDQLDPGNEAGNPISAPEGVKQETLLEKINRVQAERDLALWQGFSKLIAGKEVLIALTHRQDDCLEAIENNNLPQFLDDLKDDPWVERLQEKSVSPLIPTTASALLEKGSLPVIPPAPEPTPDRPTFPTPAPIPREIPSPILTPTPPLPTPTETPRPPYPQLEPTPTPRPELPTPYPIIPTPTRTPLTPTEAPEQPRPVTPTPSPLPPNSPPTPTFTPPGPAPSAPPIEAQLAKTFSESTVRAVDQLPDQPTVVPQVFRDAFSGDSTDNIIPDPNSPPKT